MYYLEQPITGNKPDNHNQGIKGMNVKMNKIPIYRHDLILRIHFLKGSRAT